MNVKGIFGMGTAEIPSGWVNIHPRDCKRSAEPDEDVDARLPCCHSSNDRYQTDRIED